MRINPKSIKEVDYKEEKQETSKLLSILLVFIGTFGFFVKILFF